MQRLVILIGHQLLVSSDPEGLQPSPGSLEAIARLNHASCQVVLLHTSIGDSEQTNAWLADLRNGLARVGGHVAASVEQADLLITNSTLRDITARFSINPDQAVLISGTGAGDISVQVSTNNIHFNNCDNLQQAVEQFLSKL